MGIGVTVALGFLIPSVQVQILDPQFTRKDEDRFTRSSSFLESAFCASDVRTRRSANVDSLHRRRDVQATIQRLEGHSIAGTPIRQLLKLRIGQCQLQGIELPHHVRLLQFLKIIGGESTIEKWTFAFVGLIEELDLDASPLPERERKWRGVQVDRHRKFRRESVSIEIAQRIRGEDNDV